MPNSIPPYIVKVSPRSKTVRLQISQQNGLVVTVPQGFNQRLVAGIISSKADWIERTLDKVSKLPLVVEKKLPEKLDLKAMNETWMVVYRTEKLGRLRLEEQPRGRLLLISGKVSSRLAVNRLLKEWIKAKAVRLLPDWVDRISRRTGMPYQNLTIRDQKTRWGSCSSIKNINLNMKLVFLPPHLVDYVIIHELCHTRIMSHSAAFWKLVTGYYPEYKEARKQLRSLGREIPIS